MFKSLKTFLFIILAALAVAFLHYNLPDRDIVRVVGTFEIRDDKPAGTFGAGVPDAGSKRFPNRDVRYISTKRPNDKPMVTPIKIQDGDGRLILNSTPVISPRKLKI